ncbi:MAG: oligosaccharide flippase family protein [Acholeplasmatales bacterium]|nr:oligosaccharide flippase family protein [Acholeplasmatales bacterium]
MEKDNVEIEKVDDKIEYDEIITKEDRDFSSKQEKKIFRNIIFVAVSNIITLLAGVLVGFVIPKILTITDYGYYKIFTMYFAYTGLFHFGFCDGIFLYFAGKKYDNLNREKFRLYSKFMLVTQSIVSIAIIGISMCFIGSEYMPILLFVGLCLFGNNITNYYQMISQITFRFRELSLINSIKSILTIVSIVVLYLLFKFTDFGFISYIVYVTIFTVIFYLFVFFYIIVYRDITFGKTAKLNDSKKDIFLFFKIGFPLLLSNLITVLLLNIDRQFVSIWYTTEEYSMYAFAYNLLNLVTTCISAIATVLYPSLKSKSKDELKKTYHSMNGIIMSIVTCGLMGYFPLVFIVRWILPNYTQSLDIYKIVYPGLLFSSSVSIVLANYYKSLNRIKSFFIISLIALIISVVADVIVYHTIGTMESISLASVGVLFIYYLLTELYLTKKLSIVNFKNMFFSILITCGFYLSIFLISNIYYQMIVFIFGGIVLILIFNYKNIVKLLHRQLL